MKSGFESRFLSALPESSLTERWMIGVSGGRDSVLLLHLLLSHGRGDLVVCHVDHGLRPESGEDARFVAGLAARYGLPFAAFREDVASRARRSRKSIETAARETRYAFFARAAREHDCPRIFLAHHADDQVETFLFHLFRGASARGLSGMRPTATRTIHGIEMRIVRPLLGVWREEIDACIAMHDLAFREDASNASAQHTRNRLRHEIIPFIERAFDRGIRRSVWRAAEILREEDELLGEMASPFQARAELSVPELRAQPVALQRRIIAAWLKARGIPEPSFDDVENVRHLLDGRRAKVNLPGGNHARRRSKLLFIEGLAKPGHSDGTRDAHL
jgi:tRNA(Ile)-lysidine synthase